jgi:tetratricopeptide (TPR) repeat protein
MTDPLPATPDALVPAGVQLMHAGRAQEAEAIFNSVLEQEPAHQDALLNMAQLMNLQGRANEAIMYYHRLLAITPDKLEIHNLLGRLLLMEDRLADALAHFRRALALGDESLELHRNMGDTLLEMGESAEALINYEKALKLKPESAPTLTLIGAAHRALSRYDDAIAHFRQALAIKPDFTLAILYLAGTLMLLGDFAEGLALGEKRFDFEMGFWPQIKRFAGKPTWNGQDLQGKTILVWAEQGMGDNVMMMRYLPLLKRKGVAAIIVSCHAVLMKIMLTMTNLVVDSESEISLDSFDFHCSMQSLPYLFGTTLESIPGDVPYLRLPAQAGKKWEQPLSKFAGLRVGIAWAGSKHTARDQLRSIALSYFAPLMASPGVQYFSLQKDAAALQLQEMNWPILNWMDASNDLLNTVALINQLDLVISADTVIIHLAGALGKPVWLLNRFESESRWLIEREDTPWYPTMRIFRQPAMHDWASVMDTVACELGKLISVNGVNEMSEQQFMAAADAANKSLSINQNRTRRRTAYDTAVDCIKWLIPKGPTR